jgi:7,8-dihydropterin-6-yl-methyl-4-(beta-D-ribofuranosyl)aminobenzene 5'-phosphate synthase
MDASCERIKSTVDILRELDPDFVVPCHCTGYDVVGILKAELGSMVIPGYAGYKIEISKSEV